MLWKLSNKLPSGNCQSSIVPSSRPQAINDPSGEMRMMITWDFPISNDRAFSMPFHTAIRSYCNPARAQPYPHQHHWAGCPGQQLGSAHPESQPIQQFQIYRSHIPGRIGAGALPGLVHCHSDRIMHRLWLEHPNIVPTHPNPKVVELIALPLPCYAPPSVRACRHFSRTRKTLLASKKNRM